MRICLIAGKPLEPMDHNVIGNDERDGLKTHGIGQSAADSSNTYLVYRLTNTVNGKSYIGITSRTLSCRWNEHTKRIRDGRNSRLYAAMRKYGEQAFTKAVIATAHSEDEVRKLETKYIETFDTYKNGYNSNLGGHGFLEVPADIRLKISAAQKGRIISVESRKRMSEAKLGRSECAEHFGAHTKKGADNPRSKSFLFRFPDGSERVVRGLRAFCRENSLSIRHLKGRGYSKGYELLDRFNDYGAKKSQYHQAVGKSRHSEMSENIVFSALKDAAAA